MISFGLATSHPSVPKGSGQAAASGRIARSGPRDPDRVGKEPGLIFWGQRNVSVSVPLAPYRSAPPLLVKSGELISDARSVLRHWLYTLNTTAGARTTVMSLIRST